MIGAATLLFIVLVYLLGLRANDKRCRASREVEFLRQPVKTANSHWLI